MTSSEGRPKAPLLLAAAGAVVVLLGFLGTVAELAGVAAIVVGAALSAPPRGVPDSEVAGVRWWRLLAAGALIALLGVPLSLVAETIGGLIAGAGGVLVIVAVAFGYPED